MMTDAELIDDAHNRIDAIVTILEKMAKANVLLLEKIQRLEARVYGLEGEKP